VFRSAIHTHWYKYKYVRTITYIQNKTTYNKTRMAYTVCTHDFHKNKTTYAVL